MRIRFPAAALAAVLAAACGGGSSKKDAPPLTVDVGGCCGDPTRCRTNLCKDTLHCGDGQSPRPAYVCCAYGSYCCTTDSDCQGHVPGGACDTRRSSCYADCAGDDARCTAGYHCEGAACVPDVTSGGCDEASDCASGNCSQGFDPDATTSVCAPAGTCASGNQSFPVGHTLCTGSAFLRRCDAAGRWSAPTGNPHPVAEACDAGGGAASGFHAAATCTGGLDAAAPGFASSCVSCAPYRATANGCLTAGGCANDDANCWSGYHCSAAGGNVCVSGANGSSCDVDGECTSGRCTAASVCADKLEPGGACGEHSDCTTGWCDGGTCSALKAEHLACASDVECRSGHCSNAFDPTSATSVCAPAGQCSDGDLAYDPGYTLCGGDAHARRCLEGGLWGPPVYRPAPSATCDAGGGADSGYVSHACSSGRDAASPGFRPTCVSCTPIRANASGCLAGCGGSDASCWPGFHCASSAGNTCQGSGAGAYCDLDGECASGRCDATCMAKLADGAGPCDEPSDCASGWCDGGACAAKKANGARCAAAVECSGGVCSNLPDLSAARYCTSADTCWTGSGTSPPVARHQCVWSGASVHSAFCVSAGSWERFFGFAPGSCEANGMEGYTTATCTPSSTTGNPIVATCNTCGGYKANAAFTGCAPATCSGDVACSWRHYCDTAQHCQPRLADGATGCTRDWMCLGNRCAAGACVALLPDGSPCSSWDQCASGYCGNSGQCRTIGPSCPFIYSWDGGAYAYETDAQGPLIGNARVNSRLPLYAPLYVVLPSLRPDLAGDLRVKLREGLPEIDFVDQVKLLVVDVPQGHEVVSASAENTYRLGYVNPLTLYTARDPLLPIAATDQTGASILGPVLAVDDVVAPAQGVDAPVYTFDFGTLADPSNATLLVDGWALIGAQYASTTAATSFVEVVDADGAWVRVRDLGISSGDLKTMAVPLSGLFRSATDHRVRLHVGRLQNSRWAIDRVRLDTSAPAATDVVAELSASIADLRERGAMTLDAATWNNRFHVADDTRAPVEGALGYGAFTRLGDVVPLVRDLDDTYVVMRHGDELELTFGGAVPPPAAGLRRVYVLKLSLFYKSFDESNLAEPLPFHRMSAYPYPATESFPSDPAHDAYRATYNTRVYSR